MRIMSKYIGSTVVSSVIVVLLVLLGVESFLELAAELKHIGKGSYTLSQVLVNVPMQLPTDLYELFPMAALIGCLIGLGRLAAQSELIVMLGAGLSKLQIIWAVLKATILMLVIVSVVGEFIAPKAQNFVKYHKAIAISGGNTLKIANGVWYRDGNNFIFIREITSGKELSDITRYQFDSKQRLLLASHAARGKYEQGYWTFYDVYQSLFGENHITKQFLKQQKWNITLDRRLLGLTNVGPDQMSLTKLYTYLVFRHQNGLTTGLYEFHFWKRIFQPLATMVMLFLAVPFIFGPLRTVSMGLRIVIGVIVGFSFYIMNQFFGPLSLVYQVPAIIAAVLPTILFAIMGSFLLFLRS